jgi:hypothetical protein
MLMDLSTSISFYEQYIIERELSKSDKRSQENDFQEIYCFSFYGQFYSGYDDLARLSSTYSPIC